ncbi:hypothetical protein VB713_08500 [Anabaena cylindrica UHCC 0172]|uniref:hypothetical protein n=1 Tax=Anabaena cylindrica TaxID=1165 RepID=UPI002B1F88CA|nr:hypothetical protein [Anabaena cylindrica]MEA5551016.1 hypothetical protein [Anabaena cylindrica UHCC 0172]
MNSQTTKTHPQQPIVNKFSQLQLLNLEQLSKVAGGPLEIRELHIKVVVKDQ